MMFSDYFVNSSIKIEILPTDLIVKETNILENGDQFTAVYRGINGNLIAKVCEIEFLREFIALVKNNSLNIKKALLKTIENINFSCLNPPADLDLRPKQGAMITVLYISNERDLYFAQVGNIKLKKRSPLKFKTISQNHSFSDDDIQRNNAVSEMARDLNISLKEIPSRFVGHPHYCDPNKNGKHTLINTKPYIEKVKL